MATQCELLELRIGSYSRSITSKNREFQKSIAKYRTSLLGHSRLQASCSSCFCNLLFLGTIQQVQSGLAMTQAVLDEGVTVISPKDFGTACQYSVAPKLTKQMQWKFLG